MDKEEKIKIIKEQIEEKVRPVLIFDGGNIEFIEYTDDDILKVKLLGHCHGCGMADVTLKHAVFGVLQEYVPDLKDVVALDFDEDEIQP
ncbi:MAG: NifU family protein [Rickettsiales bacterium]|jgi:Fe-S cluster biogenesis protein NfuA|nr:NifU family protein [Rickettsiales bacterium]